MQGRKILFVVSALLAMLTVIFATHPCQAQDKYPEKAIEAIVGYAGGASTDVAARIIAEQMTRILKQPVVIVNKPGGGGAIAGNELFKRKPDGYTIGMLNLNGYPENVANPERYIYKASDLLAVAQWSRQPCAIFARYDAPWNSFKEFAEEAKQKPGKLRWGHNGRGNMWWVFGTVLLQKADVKLLDVAFQGDGESMAALMGGHVDISVLTCGAGALAEIAAKKMRLLCMLSEDRFELAPDTPTAKELGYPIGIPDMYIGTFVRGGTPKEIVSRLEETIKQVTNEPEVKERMNKLGMPVHFRNSKDFHELVQSLGKVRGAYLKQLGII
jgi:tripartite-type tricarboxylate transporter receptor subunit TctC